MASSREKQTLKQTFRKGRDDILKDLSAHLNGLSLKEHRTIREKKGDRYFRGHDCQNCFEDLVKVTKSGRRSSDDDEEEALVGKIGYYCSFCSMEEPYCWSCINGDNMGAFCAGKDCGKMCCFVCKETPDRGWIHSRVNKTEGFCSRTCAESLSDDAKVKHLGGNPNYSINYQCEEEDCCKPLVHVAPRKKEGDRKGTGYYCNQCYSVIGGMKKYFCTKCLTDVGKLCPADCGKMLCGDCTEFTDWSDNDGNHRYCSEECMLRGGVQDDDCNFLVGNGGGYLDDTNGVRHSTSGGEDMSALQNKENKLLGTGYLDKNDGDNRTAKDILEEYERFGEAGRCQGVTQKGVRCKIKASHRSAKSVSLKNGQLYCLYHGGTVR